MVLDKRLPLRYSRNSLERALDSAFLDAGDPSNGKMTLKEKWEVLLGIRLLGTT